MEPLFNWVFFGNKASSLQPAAMGQLDSLFSALQFVWHQSGTRAAHINLHCNSPETGHIIPFTPSPNGKSIHLTIHVKIPLSRQDWCNKVQSGLTFEWLNVFIQTPHTQSTFSIENMELEKKLSSRMLQYWAKLQVKCFHHVTLNNKDWRLPCTTRAS